MALAALLAGGLALPRAATAAAGDPSQPGAYCKLPAPGEKPVCLEPARAQYQSFFDAVEKGVVTNESSEELEADLRSEEATDRSYLALSSLAYGYWRLAMRAAETEEVDPDIAVRLERWNALLASTYQQNQADSAFRTAVREAASDLQARTPTEGFQCVDEWGQPARCRPAEGLLATIDSFDEQLGMRGAILRVLRRLFGEDDT
jgi:hypothetical protein